MDCSVSHRSGAGLLRAVFTKKRTNHARRRRISARQAEETMEQSLVEQQTNPIQESAAIEQAQETARAGCQPAK